MVRVGERAERSVPEEIELLEPERPRGLRADFAEVHGRADAPAVLRGDPEHQPGIGADAVDEHAPEHTQAAKVARRLGDA